MTLIQEELKWTKDLDIGVKSMDKEHLELITRMSNLHRLNKMLKSKEEMTIAFNSLVSYTEDHFKEEEDFFKEIDYPDAENHKKLHTNLLKKIHAYRDEFSKGVTGRIPSSVFDFFKMWLISHIMVEDKKYARYYLTGDEKTPPAE